MRRQYAHRAPIRALGEESSMRLYRAGAWQNQQNDCALCEDSDPSLLILSWGSSNSLYSWHSSFMFQWSGRQTWVPVGSTLRPLPEEIPTQWRCQLCRLQSHGSRGSSHGQRRLLHQDLAVVEPAEGGDQCFQQRTLHSSAACQSHDVRLNGWLGA